MNQAESALDNFAGVVRNRPTSVRCLIPLLSASVVACVSAPCLAADSSLQAGLWEQHMIKNIVDGRDISGQMSQAQERIKQSMAKLPPEQQAQIQAMMGQMQGQGGQVKPDASGVQICIGPDSAKRGDETLAKFGSGSHGNCEDSTHDREGNQTHFESTCQRNGHTIHVKGVVTVSDSLITMQTDVTDTDGSGKQHTSHTEQELKYLGADCGNIKPFQPPAPRQ